jgi:hypothetical protein
LQAVTANGLSQSISTTAALWTAPNAPTPVSRKITSFRVYDGSVFVRNNSAAVTNSADPTLQLSYQNSASVEFDMNWSPLKCSSNSAFPDPTPLYEYSIGSSPQGQQWVGWSPIPTPYRTNELGDFARTMALPNVFTSSSLSASRMQYTSVRATCCSGVFSVVSSAGILLTDLASQQISVNVSAFQTTADGTLRLGPANVNPFVFLTEVTSLESPIANVSW